MSQYPDTTGLQASSGALLSLLALYRSQLSDREYVELLAILTVAVARENARIEAGRPEWLRDAA